MCLSKDYSVTNSVQSTGLTLTFWKMLVRTKCGLYSPWNPFVCDNVWCRSRQTSWSSGETRMRSSVPFSAWVSKDDVQTFVKFCESYTLYHDPILESHNHAEVTLCAIPVQVSAKDIVGIGPHEPSSYTNRAPLAVEMVALTIDEETIKRAMAGYFDIATIGYDDLMHRTVCRRVSSQASM